jgi:hypothetical protein
MFRKFWQWLSPVPTPTSPWGDKEVAAAVVEVEGLLMTMVQRKYYTDRDVYFSYAPIPGVGELRCPGKLCMERLINVPNISRAYIQPENEIRRIDLGDFIRMRPDVDVAGCVRRRVDYLLALEIARACATHEEIPEPPTPNELVQIQVQVPKKVDRPDASLERDMACGKPFVP